MGTTTSSISTGSSQYSADFAGYVSRAVQIASLPMNQLNTQKAALSDQSTAVTSLGSLFTSLQSAVTSIQSAFGGASLRGSCCERRCTDLGAGSTSACEGRARKGVSR